MVDSLARLKLVQAELDAEQVKNTRIEEENALLRRKLYSLSQQNASTGAVVNVEARIMALKMEDERDRMFENLEKIKKKYNTLHSMYLEKVKRCKALEEVFERQKTLTGLVMKSALDQRQQEQMVKEQEKRDSLQASCEIEDLEAKVLRLEAELSEAYDMIDELEFELESIDLLEMENERMRNEVLDLKQQARGALVAQANNTLPIVDHAEAESNRSSISLADDIDNETFERLALNDDLIKTVETEGAHLRRELLRSRLNNTKKLKATATDF